MKMTRVVKAFAKEGYVVTDVCTVGTAGFVIMHKYTDKTFSVVIDAKGVIEREEYAHNLSEFYSEINIEEALEKFRKVLEKRTASRKQDREMGWKTKSILMHA